MRTLLSIAVLLLPLPALAQPPKATPGNRLAHLQDLDPYYPHAKYPKFITPQWVGESDVDAVVVLAIDDMRDPAKYEKYLRPILNRLKKIDGRAPVSIMSCSVDPKDAQIQAWLGEGLSIEVHTVDHPCPYFKIGFEKAKSTYDRCVDLMNEIPDNRPVCYRMPCCDSLNTPSPRHWEEIFNQQTSKKNFLTLDSSVFQVFTSADPELPKELVLDDGQERFTKYLPADRSFVNWIENYPYPYLIGRYCWQFPCMTPSDWQANHLHKPNNPLTVRDWKAALDCTVAKKGVFNLVFHPHGWIKSEQVIELIDHAVEKHGKRVKFLTFKEAHDRLSKSLLGKGEWRAFAKSVFLVDVNNDGYLDIVDTRFRRNKTYLWDREFSHWKSIAMPETTAGNIFHDSEHLFGILQKNGYASLASRHQKPPIGDAGFIDVAVHHFNGKEWIVDKNLRDIVRDDKAATIPHIHRLLDLDGDGICEMIDRAGKVYAFDPTKGWRPRAFTLPAKLASQPRFVDLDGDKKLDLVHSDETGFGVHVFTSMDKGWRTVRSGKASDPGALPMIARKGTDNGFFLHSGSLWWANEDTHLMKHHVDRRTYGEALTGK